MRNPPTNPATGWQYSAFQLKVALGLPVAMAKRMPPGFAGGPYLLNGVRVWINPSSASRVSRFLHRVRAECPKCKQDVPAGRMHQHVKIHLVP